MNEYIFFMYGDATDLSVADDGTRWEQYISSLRASGQFEGGSSIGQGARFKKNGLQETSNSAITGYIRVHAENIDAAKRFLVGNPTFEAGGTIEIRELMRS